jgi:hypothetical protein
MCAQLNASVACAGLTPQLGGGSTGVVDPFAEDMYGDVPKEFVKELPNDPGPKFLPTLDENELSIGVIGLGVVEIEDTPLPYTEFSLLGPAGICG